MSGVINSLNMPVHMPSASPTIGDVLTADTTSSCIWQAPSGGSAQSYMNLSIPWSNWSYFVGTTPGYPPQTMFWTFSDGINGAQFAGVSQRDFGNVNLNIPVNGTYRFSVLGAAQFNSGIATFTINSVVTNVDFYAAANGTFSYTWDQVLPAGLYTVNLNSLTKNIASTDYVLNFIQPELNIRQIA